MTIFSFNWEPSEKQESMILNAFNFVSLHWQFLQQLAGTMLHNKNAKQIETWHLASGYVFEERERSINE